MSQHILVTGGCGFIGSAFILALRRERPDWTVTNLDRLTYAGNPDNLASLADDPAYRFVHGDVADRAALAPLVDACSAVVHLAAETHVDRSIENAAPFIHANVLGVQVLLDAMRRRPDAPLVLVSSDEVYGSLPLDRPDLRFTEESPLDPRSPYAASKAAGDMLALAAWRTHGTDVRIARAANNFGPRQYPEKLIPRFVIQLLRNRQVPLYGDGLNVRDWIHVEDHARALIAILERGQPGRVYNVGADNQRSNLELTRELIRILGRDESAIAYVPDRPGHDRRYALDASRIRTELGWTAQCSDWPGALEATAAWYRDHPEWWTRLADQPLPAAT